MVGVGALSAPSGAQDDPVVDLEPVSQATDGTPLPGVVGSPAISDDGSIAVFATPGGVSIRDRVNATTIDAPDAGAVGPAVSGDGCVVTYSVPGDQQSELVALERCSTPSSPTRTVVGSEPVPQGLAAGAVSADGSVAAWSTGSEIVRYVAPSVSGAGTWQRVDAFDTALTPTPGVTTEPQLDITPDGGRIAYAAGAPANVYVWSDGATIELVSASSSGSTIPANGDSIAPTFAAAGSLLAFQSAASDLAAYAADAPATPAVVVLDIADPTSVQRRLLVGSATSPHLAPDGRALAYQQDGTTRVQRSAQDGPPFATTDVVDVASVVAPQPAVVANQGSSGVGNRTVVFASGQRDDLTADARFHTGAHVWARPVALAPPPPPPTTDPTTTTPATTSAPTTAAPPPTTPAPTTTVPASLPDGGTGNPSTPLPGLGSIDGGAVIGSGGFQPTSGNPFFSSGSSGGFGGSSGSFGGSTQNPGFTPTVDPSGVVTVQPSPVEFAPTIVDAGRRVATAEVVGGGDAVTVTAVEVAPVTDFGVAEDGCTGSALSAGATCPIDIAFAPTVTGEIAGEVVVRFDDGGTARAALTGVGAPAPTLTVIPDVVVPGQVVTLRGGGFPAGSTIEWEWEGGTESGTAVVDEQGSFNATIVVLPRTARGPHVLTVIGQADMFDEVSVELLVGSRADGSASAVIVRAASGR